MSTKTVLSRRRCLQWLGAAATAVWTLPTLSAARLHGFRIVQQDNVHLYLDLNAQPVDARVFTLAGPDRLVIDLAESSLDTNLPATEFAEGVIQRIRYAAKEGGHLRVVVDLRGPVSPTYQFVKRQGGSRMVVDLGVKGNPALANLSSQIIEESAQPVKPLRNLVVAIDPGHGGRDPGAIGRRKTREKDVNLSIGKRLYKRLKAEKGVTPILTRTDDTYIGLRERIDIARESHADLFVSLHADAVPRKSAQGSSVYALSLKGASSETAQWLADNENKADLFGDVALDGMSRDLKQTLIELAQNSTLESSIELGESVLGQLKRVGAVHKSTVELANFAVLKSPDIPSILVETAFISNPSEERKLRSRKFQDRVASAVHSGIMNYFRLRAPAGTILAAQTEASRG
ncbi:MAG: N-acetylmuramoyl-L-alanine amidase [Gammaproteobacteria bacterium]|nr:N-acetylmuramoyl-L-alanine amidase [Gammaproteobacteria bacterium]